MNVAKQPKTGTYNEDKAIYKYGKKNIQKLNFCSRALHSLKVLCGETFFLIHLTQYYKATSFRNSFSP